ncbi:hypothetical protein FHS60_000214 [Alloprevotella rava]|uniref:Uncharacterized protein n=1 Tax=Alloprevotella rava TaxID=671218 RepID=A0A7W5UKM2_9BACT|nr:hypothetical protein [Alloprevotella rava]
MIKKKCPMLCPLVKVYTSEENLHLSHIKLFIRCYNGRKQDY